MNSFVVRWHAAHLVKVGARPHSALDQRVNEHPGQGDGRSGDIGHGSRGLEEHDACRNHDLQPGPFLHRTVRRETAFTTKGFDQNQATVRTMTRETAL